MYKIGEGMSDKVPVFVQWLTMCIGSYIIALVKGWKLALVCLAFSPLMFIIGAAMGRVRTLLCWSKGWKHTQVEILCSPI
jgi:ABC-type multidrug transport system fused ATPase/permease subunit